MIKSPLRYLLTFVTALWTALSAAVSEELLIRNTRGNKVDGATVAFVSEEGSDPWYVISVPPKEPQILRMFHQISKVSIAAHGHGKSFQTNLCVNRWDIYIQSVTFNQLIYILERILVDPVPRAIWRAAVTGSLLPWRHIATQSVLPAGMSPTLMSACGKLSFLSLTSSLLSLAVLTMRPLNTLKKFFYIMYKLWNM